MEDKNKKVVAILVRHGDTDQNDANVFRSRLDPHLNDKGVKQAKAAAKFIKENYYVYKIVTSPLLRAIETADLLSDQLHVSIEQDRALISWNLGCLTGKDKDLYADILDYYVDNPKKTIPEGEALDDLEARTQEFFEEELRKPWDESVPVYVTHSSNVLTLGNILDDKASGRQESGELVGPGGVLAVHETKDGFSIEPVFGKEVPSPEFGS